jgi:hypothetical protein
MPDEASRNDLFAAVQRYFDLMYDSDVAQFDQVFHDSAQLHGFREGAMAVWSAAKFRDVLASRPSPKSLHAPRREEPLLADFASEAQAVVKVRVRINAVTFIDHLTFLRIGPDWRITSKAYHVESVEPKSGEGKAPPA